MTTGEAETPDTGVPAAAVPETQGTEDTTPETLFSGVETPAPETPEEPVINTPEKPEEEPTTDGERPEWLPEKFNNPEDLVKAYNEMGAKIREKNEPPESYDIKITQGEAEEAVDLSEDEVAIFKEAGLTNEQAQKLTQYFHESVIPQITEAKTEVEKQRLAMDWGIEPDSNDFTQQLANVKAWAQQNLPDAAVNELSRSAAGVKTLANLMEQSAQGHKVTGHASNQRPDKAQLQELMNDPRYWQGDDTYKNYVREQFKKAFD